MEARTGNQEIGSILRCGKEQEATTLSPKRTADDRMTGQPMNSK